MSENLEQILKTNLEKRKLCERRGYHLIERKPETSTSSIVCYDCNLGTNKLSAKFLKIEYKIQKKNS